MRINTKLNIMACSIMLVFSVLIAYLIYSLISFGNSYNQIVKNITAANAYNLDFKKDIDYVIYRMIVGCVGADHVEDETGLQSPYVILDEARGVFRNLEEITTGSGNARRLGRLQKSFNTLEKRMDEINSTVELSGYYDRNMEKLDGNIRLLTEIIQESIQEYIYYEASNLENVRLQLKTKQDQAVILSIAMLVIAAIITSLSSFFIAGSIAKPIQKLCKITEIVGKGNFTTRVETGYGDEISILTDSFNSMIGRIEVLIEDIKEEQKNLRITELKLLQAQINPHFLYNTLDTIIWLAEGNQSEEVVSMVASLSAFFRSTLSEGRDFVYVYEEEEHIRSYLEIQQFRYRDILTYEINIPEQLKKYSIIKLTLQPLVENALYHGIKNKRGKGHIRVKAEEKGRDILFQVMDNGIGMTEEKQKELMEIIESRNTKHTEGAFGLRNLNERIRLHYGSKYGLFIESIYGEGTAVKLLIPKDEETDNRTEE